MDDVGQGSGQVALRLVCFMNRPEVSQREADQVVCLSLEDAALARNAPAPLAERQAQSRR